MSAPIDPGRAGLLAKAAAERRLPQQQNNQDTGKAPRMSADKSITDQSALTYNTASSQLNTQSRTVATDSQNRPARTVPERDEDDHRPRFNGSADARPRLPSTYETTELENTTHSNEDNDFELDQTLLDITAGHQLNLNEIIMDIMQSKTDNTLNADHLDLTAFDAGDFAQKVQAEPAMWHAAIVALQERRKKDLEALDDLTVLEEQVVELETALTESRAAADHNRTAAERRAARLTT
ncbi:hypothetical protein KCU62_g9960, partial [Aureobasidium sp. EXF-3399]